MVTKLLFASDVYLVALGLTVALVVYPSFHLVGTDQWTGFHRSHMRQMVFAVAPAWIAQGTLSIWWLLQLTDTDVALVHGALALLAVTITLTQAVPLHGRLERHHDSHDIERLQHWHWARTSLWVGCALLSLRTF